RCFPHIVNLACKAVLRAITNMDHAQNDAIEYVPNMPPSRDFMSAIERDPIATVRTIVRVTRASGLRRQCFSEIVKVTKQTDLQLLRDIDICWSSTLLMIEHAILLHAALDVSRIFSVYVTVLSLVMYLSLTVSLLHTQVPHAFQQKLSSKKTPTLCDSILSFEAMSRVWQQQADKYPDCAAVIQPGLDKLEAYHAHISCVPAYVLAMGESLKIFRCEV
ncbi:hypothetical protein C8R48DRAFT_591897, partial [Suillus tomentosus]